ncbi:class II fumarate hydratase [Peptoniphilus catoniae]|uniref:class II fumarate hydratase n=1 Tax=Peptoniphilus catoniae TaxID=1660341 RepID=UPI0010FDF823|nr:class II fumarate hydratase [Peptoniphilus catoniae]
MKYKLEHDAMGEIQVPANVYWGSSTQRSLNNFKIGKDKMPLELIYAMSILKAACAIVNFKNKDLSEEKSNVIVDVVNEIISGELDDNFPLKVFQTGSGTQTNMNINEVIANRGNEILKRKLLHPNDDVNMSQSSNDVFPSAMHIAAVIELDKHLIPQLSSVIETFKGLEEQYGNLVKIGRTHLQDATPIKFSQELSGYRTMLENSKSMISLSMENLLKLAIGGTAVGTGINARKNFGNEVCSVLRDKLNYDFISSENKFHSLTSKDDLVFAHGALKALSANLFKIANDIRLLSSGPRCGIGELTLPENEPGSSIMPGKVNPTQAEALTMVCIQVMGNDAAIGFAASQGQFELNTFMPLIIYNFLNSARLLTDALNSFNINCLKGIKPREDKMKAYLDKSLMLVTALNPYIGYENSVRVVNLAYKENLSLKEAVIKLDLLSSEDFDRFMDLEKML